MLQYRKLEIWQISKELVKDIYNVTDKFPDKERYCLVSQINRNAISVSSNIAEGSSRFGSKDQAHFEEIAFGSLMELACQLEISSDLGYIANDTLDELLLKIKNLAVKISNYRKTLLKAAER